MKQSLKGLSNKKILSPKPHILDSKGAVTQTMRGGTIGPRGATLLGPRLAAPWDLAGQEMVPQGSMALPHEVCAAPIEVPWRQTLRPKFSILGGFLALPTETIFTTLQYYPKCEVWAIELFLW